MIHRSTHPEFVEGCYGCKISTLDVGGMGLLRFAQYREANMTERGMGREIEEEAKRTGRPISKANRSDIGPMGPVS